MASTLIPPGLKIPQGRNWLLKRLQGAEPARAFIRLQAAAARSQLENLLGQPDMQALLRAAPQIGRELRPICRMLGVAADPALFPPPPRRRPKPKPATPAARPARPKPEKPPARRRRLSDHGPPARPGWERPARGFLSPVPRPPKPG